MALNQNQNRQIVRPLDFRSDTLTQPTDNMRQAMADAIVGDDVFGEDETINKLEQRAAKLMGMEAALFVPTGTMGNQIAIWSHTGRRGQIITEDDAHIALYEGGGAALLSNVLLRTVRGDNGVFCPEQLQKYWTPDDPHFCQTRLVSLENTHNASGGNFWSPQQTAAVVDAAHEHNCPVHVDGARIWNAAVAQNTTPQKLLAGADSVMFCLSKGLSAPVGSLLCGTHDFIASSRHVRKTLGGGMRQAGHLAAAGLEALKLAPRLAEDHANARQLADGLSQISALKVRPEVPTNMVLADVSKLGLTALQFADEMAKIGVLCLNIDAGPVVRFVTHRGVNSGDVDEAVARMAQHKLLAS